MKILILLSRFLDSRFDFILRTCLMSIRFVYHVGAHHHVVCNRICMTSLELGEVFMFFLDRIFSDAWAFQLSLSFQTQPNFRSKRLLVSAVQFSTVAGLSGQDCQSRQNVGGVLTLMSIVSLPEFNGIAEIKTGNPG